MNVPKDHYAKPQKGADINVRTMDAATSGVLNAKRKKLRRRREEKAHLRSDTPVRTSAIIEPKCAYNDLEKSEENMLKRNQGSSKANEEDCP
jgi:hypothetical protein